MFCCSVAMANVSALKERHKEAGAHFFLSLEICYCIVHGHAVFQREMGSLLPIIVMIGSVIQDIAS